MSFFSTSCKRNFMEGRLCFDEGTANTEIRDVLLLMEG